MIFVGPLYTVIKFKFVSFTWNHLEYNIFKGSVIEVHSKYTSYSSNASFLQGHPLFLSRQYQTDHFHMESTDETQGLQK